MKESAAPTADHLRLLLGLDARRARTTLQRPGFTTFLAIFLPLLVVGSALWLLGSVVAPRSEGAAGGLTLGMLVAGSIAFAAHGVLTGGRDAGFLRQLGLEARALYLERSLRVAALGAAVAGALVVPYLLGSTSAGAAVRISIASAAATVASATLVFAWAARTTVTGEVGVLSIGIRQFDPDLAKAAPLVYAPLLPFLAGAATGALAGGLGMRGWIPAAAATLAIWPASLWAGAIFAPAAPRFLPRVGEMAYTPPPRGEGEGFRIGRGLSALLPARAAAVWVRDATVAGRRFRWASRVTWPVGIVAIVALARWGELPATRAWVVAAVAIALVVQSAAVVGLGHLERQGTRWLDRSGGLQWPERLIGRWAWAWGLTLWLLVPVALAWAWWAEAAGAWLWPLAGAVTAGLAATVSLLVAEPG